jgi:hypothetical protein
MTPPIDEMTTPEKSIVQRAGAEGAARPNGLEAVEQGLQTTSVWCELGDEIQDLFVMKV